MRIANKLAVFSIALFTAGLVQAAQTDSVGTYDSIDSNGDGKISKSEAQAEPGLKDQWDKLDVDRNGTLSEGEFARFEVEGDAETEGGAGAEGGAGGEAGTDRSGGVLDMK